MSIIRYFVGKVLDKTKGIYLKTIMAGTVSGFLT
jgi:hypothetical protein